MMRSDIVPGRPDPEGLLALVRTVFPGEDVGDPRFLSWLYDLNPSGPAVEVMAKSGDSVRGHIAVLPQRYKVGRDAVSGGVVVNAITHPDFRGRGIFMVLHEELFQSPPAKGLAFSFGFANPKSEKGCFRHLGYQELGRLPFWILPFNLPRILAAQPSWKGAAGRAAARAAQPFVKLWRATRRPRGASLTVIENATEFGPEFDDLWLAASAGAENILVRDRAFLDWRFIRSPTRRYDVFTARKNGRLVGYLVGRTTVIEGLTWGMIMDILSEDTPDGRAAIFHLVAAYDHHIALEGADVAACLMFKHAPAARGLRRNGYIVCPPTLLPREFPALLRWYGPGSPPARFFNQKSWFLTLADYDAM
jgi:hypothetical protein